MNIEKQFKCRHCGSVVKCDSGVCELTCSCGKIKLVGETLVEGQIGVDAIDVSQKLILG